MHKSCAIFFCIAVTAAPLSAFADARLERFEGPLSLEQASSRVQAVGYDVRETRAAMLIAQSQLVTRKSTLAPQLAFSATMLDGNLAQLGMPIARQVYGSATFSLPLLSVAASRSAQAAEEDSAAAKTDVETVRQDAAFAAIQAYRRAESAAAIAQVRAVAVADEREHVRVTQVRIAAGKLPRYVAARDRAALAQAEQMAEDANAEADKALADLTTLLAYDPVASRITLTDPLEPVAFNLTREKILSAALANRSEIAATERRVAAARLMLASARAAYLPNATLTGQSYTGVSSPNLGGSGGQIGLALSLPIADGASRSGAVIQASGELERAQVASERARANISREIVDSWRDLQAARLNLATARAARDDAEAQRSAMQLRERAGKAIDLEVLDALTVVASAREGVIRSIATYDVAVAAVRRAAAYPKL